MADPTGFTPFSGVNAIVKAIAVTPDLTQDQVSAPGGATTNWLEFTTFTIDRTQEGPEVISSACSSDAQGNIWPIKLRGGLARATIDLEGVYNGDSTAGAATDVRMIIGGHVKLDLIFHATNTYGIYAILAKVVDSSTSAIKKGSDPHMVKLKLEVNGVLPAPSYLT